MENFEELKNIEVFKKPLDNNSLFDQIILKIFEVNERPMTINDLTIDWLPSASYQNIYKNIVSLVERGYLVYNVLDNLGKKEYFVSDEGKEYLAGDGEKIAVPLDFVADNLFSMNLIISYCYIVEAIEDNGGKFYKDGEGYGKITFQNYLAKHKGRLTALSWYDQINRLRKYSLIGIKKDSKGNYYYVR